MNGQEIRDRLLHSYERSYDIVKPSEVNGHTYDACASYHESGAKYVLSKKAELWRISCHEHAYFKAVEELNDQDVETFLTDLTEWIEPKVVREGKEVPDTDHMYTLVVEGDSALGSVKLSRDGEFQGIMPVRGKILNCLKADYPRIFKSEIITDLLKVLGCGVEVTGKFVKDLNAFDINNLRWNKVILCTDADVDGFQIRTLILTMIYRLCPTLIREGYVYIAETPLFEITCGEKTWFAYTDKEKNDIVKTLEGKRYKVDRSKGLGENDPEMMWLTTMNPETRRLIKVMPEDAEATAHSFDLLLGDNLQGRKDHIAENGYKYLEMIDVS